MGGEPGKENPRRLFLRPQKIKNVMERVNKEMYVRNLELAQTNRTLSLLRTIDKLVLESEGSAAELSDEIAHAISQSTNYPLVAILAQKKNHANILQVYGWDKRAAVDGPTEDTSPELEITDDQVAWLASDAASVVVPVSDIAQSHHVFADSTQSKRILRLAEMLGVRSVYIVKLTARGHLVGLMVVGLVSDEATSGVTANDQDLINRLGGAVGVALDNKLLLEENRRVLEQLQKSNDKLKALDETKDEFISMASHQLRTPLTSIKGYISMVLEGDAGKIEPQQHKLLTEAFNSSERMVRLIADFLNVSRLQTGKFTIEKAPLDIKHAIRQEISNLEIIAKTRGMKIKLNVTKDALPLTGDESKLRQIMMNFIDNAIYYSHQDSTIVVNLEKVKSSLEFTVIDTGIGVPEEEQAKLFTKFFRAGNARKQRPDGTGVGLYLARRVVTGHGGTIVFSSKEGVGSTFGFRIPLDKHSTK